MQEAGGQSCTCLSEIVDIAQGLQQRAHVVCDALVVHAQTAHLQHGKMAQVD